VRALSRHKEGQHGSVACLRKTIGWPAELRAAFQNKDQAVICEDLCLLLFLALLGAVASAAIATHCFLRLTCQRVSAESINDNNKRFACIH
jgi:hypothetical protein